MIVHSLLIAKHTPSTSFTNSNILSLGVAVTWLHDTVLNNGLPVNIGSVILSVLHVFTVSVTSSGKEIISLSSNGSLFTIVIV